MPTLTKAAIVDAIQEKTDRHRSEIQEYVNDLLDLMTTSLKKDQHLLFSGFGKFEVYAKEPRRGRNPQTNEKITLPGRKVAVFRLSRKFRDELNPKG